MGKRAWRYFPVCYYEYKDVPVKGRVYRYWYLRVREGGRMRSIYIGKVNPAASPREYAQRAV